MRVLNFSLDKAVLDANSPVAKRIAALSAAAGEVVVLTPFFYRDGKIAQFFKLWKQAKRVLSEKQFDLITVQDTAYLALLAYLLARTARVPFEVQVHGLEKFYGIRKLLARFLLKRADKIRVVSERLKRFLESRFKIHTSRIYELAVYAQMGEKGERGRRGTGEPFVFLTVGRLVPVKNISLQIRAFARLVKEYPQVRLRIVGDGSERSNIQFLISNFQLGDKAVVEGEQRDVGHFYEEADAFLLTSDYEGWGLAVTEAAAYGLPIIMTDVGLAMEFIKNGENGIIVPVGDESALVSAMRRLITSGELRARLGEAAFRAFKALPSAEEQIRKQVEEWRGLQ